MQTGRDQIEAMSKAERDRLYKQLLAEAATRLGARRWRHQSRGIPPGAVEAQDIVSSVLLSALRSSVQVLDLYSCLRNEIAKKVDALRNRSENRDHRIEDFMAAGVEVADPNSRIHSGLFPAEQAILRKETAQRLNSDPTSLARRVFDLTIEDFSPKFIASKLNVGVDEVYEERKKAKKALQPFLKSPGVTKR
jgi:hypothetical protein